jgi:hypothetical protein
MPITLPVADLVPGSIDMAVAANTASTKMIKMMNPTDFFIIASFLREFSIPRVFVMGPQIIYCCYETFCQASVLGDYHLLSHQFDHEIPSAEFTFDHLILFHHDSRPCFRTPA